jgi:hypothetical protein
LHALPPQEELEYLIGSEMGQITIDPYQVGFLLSGVEDVLITVSEPFIYRDGNLEDMFAPDAGSNTQAPVRFHALLKQKLLDLVVSPDGDNMILQFEKGRTLMIQSNVGGPYESGSISGRGGLLIF